MKVLVPIKHVVDYNVKVRVCADHHDVDIAQAKMSINPFDEIALEACIQWKEQGIVDEIIAISIGPSSWQNTLLHALAMGADRAILIESDNSKLEPLNVAKCLAKMVVQTPVDLVMMGKQSIDGDHNQTPQMLAGLLDWPQATFASEITLEPTHAKVTREIDSGSETLQVKLPAVISADLRLNTPRYLSLPNIMRAKSKPITVMPLTDMDVDLITHTTIVTYDPPPKRKAGKQVADINVLLDCLKQEGIIT